MCEEWRDIYFTHNNVEYDYRNLYQVSNLGRVKSLRREMIKSNGVKKTINEKIITPKKKENGYLKVSLYKDTEHKNFYIHRLVAFMFIENDDVLNKIQINHKDENKENNTVDNLEWCTVEYNQNYGTKNMRMSHMMIGRKANDETKRKLSEMRSGSNNPNSRSICQFDLDGNLINMWDYMTQVKEVFGENKHQGISKCCRGKQQTAYGFMWKYKEDVSCEIINEYHSKKEMINDEKMCNL